VGFATRGVIEARERLRRTSRAFREADEASPVGDDVWRRSGGFRLTPAPQPPRPLSLLPRAGAWQPLRILRQGALGTWSLIGAVAGARRCPQAVGRRPRARPGR